MQKFFVVTWGVLLLASLFVPSLLVPIAYGQSVALSVTNTIAADFDVIGATGTASGNISLGTNDSITYGAGYDGSGIGTSGGFTLNGDPGFPVDVFCKTGATLATSGGDTMPISDVEVVADINGTGTFGAGNACQGLSTAAMVFTIQSSTADNRFSFGVEIDGSGGVPSGDGTFSTSNPSGSDVQFEFVYQ